MARSVSFETFELYFHYRVFDFFSEGDYKKQVVQCKDTGDAWASKVYAGMQEVSSLIKRVSTEVSSLQEFGKTRLQMACVEVMASATPPCRRKKGWHMCSITGVRSDECMDLTRPGKSEHTVTVARSFSHFFVMLWLIAKMDHVCKTVARSWLVDKGTEFESGTPVKEMCEAFVAECGPVVQALFRAFEHACAHVLASLDAHKRAPDFA